MNSDSKQPTSLAIAVVGLAGRFPGAGNHRIFWENLRDGVESIRRLTDEELLNAGVDPQVLHDPNYVKAAPVLDGIELFDAPFFGFSPKDAAIMDPQHRVFLECAWEALENAGWTADEFPGSIGVFAGSGMNAYLMFHLVPNQQLMSSAGLFLLKQTGNDKDVLATRVSYQLNLTGPSITIQTACSTSLVAVHVACQSLLNHECDMALAGGVTIEIPHKLGYLRREGEILSRDGHCRAFDAESSGTVFGSGAGVVVLRRLEDALADGDCIRAVIRGSAINNDGARKVGYLAPSVTGQAEVVAEALAVADVDAESISYIETHGTGTPVGDPIEMAALTEAFQRSTQARGFCGIGSLKSNIGHLDAAAGVAGLIKTVLALEHRQLPPSLHFTKPNPQINFANSPFYVNNRLAEWKSGATPRRAGVTSLGIGGTNAHVILEEAPAVAPSGESRPWQVLTLSAKTASALETAAGNLADHLAEHPELNLADTAFTCHLGRKAFTHRRAVVCRTREEAIEALCSAGAKQVFHGQEPVLKSIAFLFPGQGAQYANMAHGIYQSETVFRAEVDRCAELLQPHLDVDLRTLLYPAEGANLTEATAQLTETHIAQPALFVIEYALAKLWISWGVRPAAMIGHSLGEFVAACLADVLSLEDALMAVVARGRLMQSALPGAMLAVQLAEEDARALASGGISLAAVNGPRQCVLSGPAAAIEAAEKKLATGGVLAQRLQTSRAFHSASMDAILGAFTQVMRGCKLQAPQIPYISNVTGSWITPEEATDAAYWARHLRETVRFADGLATLWQQQPVAMLEAGPGRVLAGLAARHPEKTASVQIVSSLRGAQEAAEDLQILLAALAQLWVSGGKVNWNGFHAGERRQRVELPTYPFERRRYWIDAPKAAKTAVEQPSVISYFEPVWKRAELPSTLAELSTWLVFLDSLGVGATIASDLERAGHKVVALAPGERFAKTGKNSYKLDPGSRADYDRLLENLLSTRDVPQRILHLWSLVPRGSAPAAVQNLETAQALNFYSLLYLAQAIGVRDISSPVSLAVVSNGLQSVGGEAVHHPEQAMLAGPGKVIPKEFASIRTRLIDVDLAETGDAGGIVRHIIAEASQAFSQPSESVAYRGDERWIETIEPVRMERTGPRLRRQGVYLITGGTGGIGLEIAEHLARTLQAKLILVSRTGRPRRDDALARLRGLGAEVEVAQADVTDLAAMRDAVSQVCQKFGRINGAIHAAGALDDGLIQLKQKDAADRVLAPKVKGALVLEQALAGHDLDFLILFSSVSCYTAPVGQVDYVAANAFLDAYATANHAAGKPWTLAINWGRWSETGMAAQPARPSGERGGHPLLGVAATSTRDALVYHTVLSFDDDWLLHEHRLRGGDALFPGTGYLELARAAMRDRLGTGAVEFQPLSFSAPLRVAPGKTRSIELRLTRQGDAYHFTVAGAGSPALCSTGTLRALYSAPPRNIDLPALVERCRQRQLTFGPHEQNAKQAQRIEFGPRWRCLRRLHFGEYEAVCYLELPEEYAVDLETYRLHPALLDAATGSAIFTIPGYDGIDDLYVPVSYGSIHLFGDLPRRLWCHIRWPRSNHVEKEIATFDMSIADERGAVIVEIKEFALRRLASTALLAGEAVEREQVAISSVAGVSAFAAIVDGPPLTRILAVPSGLRLDEPAPAAAPTRTSTAPTSSDDEPRDEVERLIAQWWQELLGLERVSIHQDFFDLGGHSLVALRLFTKIKNYFGLDFGLATLFEARTIEDLANLIRTPQVERSPSSVVGIRTGGSKPSLFLIHGAYGNVVRFQTLVQHLRPDQPVYGIQSQALEKTGPALMRVEDIAAYYVRELRKHQPAGPYHFAGYSFGGIVAFEMARQLHAMGEHAAFVGLIDTWHPNRVRELNARQTVRQKLARRIEWFQDHWREICRPRRVEYLKRRLSARFKRIVYTIYDAAGKPAPHSLEDVRDINSFAAINYKPGFYPGRIDIFRAEKAWGDKRLGHLLGWDGLAESIEAHDIPGGHLDTFESGVIEVLAREIEACLKRAASEYGSEHAPTQAADTASVTGE